MHSLVSKVACLVDRAWSAAAGVLQLDGGDLGLCHNYLTVCIAGAFVNSVVGAAHCRFNSAALPLSLGPGNETAVPDYGA
jgi:hypothetical protein